MRPKKKVLLIGSYLSDLGPLRYVLQLRRYKVTLACDAVSVLDAASQESFACAVVWGPSGLGFAEAVMMDLGRQQKPDLPILLVVPKGTETSAAATVVAMARRPNGSSRWKLMATKLQKQISWWFPCGYRLVYRGTPKSKREWILSTWRGYIAAWKVFFLFLSMEVGK